MDNNELIKDNFFNILIVDDHNGIHRTTKNAFFEETIFDKPIHFISAYNENEAIEILKVYHKEICVVLLDIVLTEENDGLVVIDYLRKSLNNQMLQIIIRTGEPGRFPMREIIDKYDINNYIEKGETSDDQLYLAVKSAIRAYNDIDNLEQKVEERTKELNQVFNVSTPLIQIDNEHKILKANESIVKMFKLKKGSIGKTCYDIFGCDKYGTHHCSLIKLQKKNRNKISYDSSKILPDGKELIYTVNAVPIRNEKGEIISVVENVIDITEIKKAERKALDDKNKLRTLIDNFPGFIYIKDVDSKFIIANKELKLVFDNLLKKNGGKGKLPDNLNGLCDHDFYPKELADKFKMDEQEIIKTGNPIKNKFEIGFDKNGKEIKVLTTKVPLKSEEGKIIGIVGIGRDISEFVKLQEERNRSIEIYTKRYRKFKHNAGDLINELFQKTQKCNESHILAWLIASEIFIGYELFSNYLMNNKLEKSDTRNPKVNSIFDLRFLSVIDRLIKNIFKKEASINIKIDSYKKLEKVNKKEFQLIIINIIYNIFKHQIAGKKLIINISMTNEFIIISNNNANAPKDIDVLYNKIIGEKLEIEGISLFTIHKYFWYNYERNIEIDYKNNEFIVKLPIKIYRR